MPTDLPEKVRPRQQTLGLAGAGFLSIGIALDWSLLCFYSIAGVRACSFTDAGKSALSHIDHDSECHGERRQAALKIPAIPKPLDMFEIGQSSDWTALPDEGQRDLSATA